MKKSFTLQQYTQYGDFYCETPPMHLCISEVESLWELSGETDIEVVVSTEKTKNSYAVKRGHMFEASDFSIHHDEGWNWLVLYSAADAILVGLFKKTGKEILYVSVEMEG